MSKTEFSEFEPEKVQPVSYQLSTKTPQLKHSVSQSYALIHSIQRLLLRPKRLLLSAIAKVNPEAELGDKPCVVRISALEWAKQWDTNPRNAYRDLQMASEGLAGKRFWIKDTEEEQRWRHWINGATYKHNEGYVEVELDRYLMPFITGGLSLFSSFKIEHVRDLDSANAIRLYELLNQFVHSGHRNISLDELRDVLDCVHKTKRWSDFNRWVLNPLVTQINERTNLEVIYSPYKTGRAVTSIRFILDRRRNWTPAESNYAYN